MHTDNVNPDRLKDILSKESGERVICQFLKEHPSLVYWTFCLTGGHVNYVFSEFTVGNQYRADFVILHTYSGAFEAHFIELEPIRDPIFSKNKKPSKRLSDAIKQIDEWKEYAKGNEPSVRIPK